MKIPYKMITRQTKFNATHHTEMNHLGALYMLEPAKVQSIVDQLFATQTMFNSHSIASSIFLQGGEPMMIDRNEWTWEKTGETGRPFVLLADLPAEAGKGRQTFEGEIDEKSLVFGDILTFGDFDHKWQIIVQSDARKTGAGAKYTFKLNTDNPALSIPTKFLKKGTKVRKLYSQFGEGSELSGSMQMMEESFELYNRASRLRKHYTVTGDVVNSVLEIKVGIPDGKGGVTKQITSWVRWKEANFMRQFMKEKAFNDLYSRSNTTIKDSTGRPTLAGAGVFEQLEAGGHRHVHSGLTTNLLKEFINDIHFSRVEPGTRMNLQAFSGREGIDSLHTAIENGLLQGQLIQVTGNQNFNTAQPTESKYHDNSYAVGHQFTKLRLKNGVDFTINYEPLYDDPNLNFELDPVTQRPLSSSRITFLDFTGNEGTSSNVRRVRVKGGYGLSYVCGMVTPTGRRQGGEAAHAGDYYEMHVHEQCGAHIDDPTKCGDLILSRS